jgi:hypothetical protein
MAGATWECPVEEVLVEHRHRRGGDRGVIPVYVRVPGPDVAKGEGGEGERKKSPVVVLMTGLDGYRPDNTVRCDEFLKRGW